MTMSEEINRKLNESRMKDKESDMEYEKQMKKSKEEHESRIQAFNNKLGGKTRPATKTDYMRWLKGFLENGGEVTHVYDYDMHLIGWEVVTQDFEISPLYGSESKNLIVEEGVVLKGGAEGHCGMYFMDGFRLHCGIVPIYSDIIF